MYVMHSLNMVQAILESRKVAESRRTRLLNLSHEQSMTWNRSRMKGLKQIAYTILPRYLREQS